MKTEKFWDRLAGSFDRMGKTKKVEESYQLTLNGVKPHLNPSHTVLDFGCATGAVAIDISSNAKRVLGIDISSRMIEIANSKIGDLGLGNVSFEQSTIYNDNLASNSFDIILGLNILHLMTNPQRDLKRLNDLLKPNGIFISSTDCAGERKRSFLNAIIYILGRVGLIPPMNFFRVAELEGLISKEGFEVIESYKLNPKNLRSNHFIVAKKK